MSRFPKLTETFVLNEVLAVERLGVDVEMYPLMRGHDSVLQPGAAELAARANYAPFISWAIFASQLRFLVRRPRAYLRSLLDLIRDNLGRPRFLAAGLVLFPKIVHAAGLMASANVDHVHCHFARHPALAGLIISRLTGIPFSFTAHGSDVHVDRHMLCRKLAEAAFAIAIADFNRSVIEAECGSPAAGKVRVIHCGVDRSVFDPKGTTTPSDRLRIVCVGTLHEVKGQVHLIEACALLRDLGIRFACRFVGGGPDEALLHRTVQRLGLEESVMLAGPMAREAVIEELRSADVLVAPSVISARGQREGIPVVLMEAMSCGLPVVSSRLSGIPELVENEVNGLLVTPGSATELAAALARLAKDASLRERLGNAGRLTIERDFDLDANAARLVGMFELAVAT